ncbi:MAG: filamentous hemagglutinin N-terminal domain-containing protein, partial [Phycisphaerae bacterium]|nr:filamentous hemagglutinin N-terminal domain-containing protein [Phycisphaerae bacterium]
MLKKIYKEKLYRDVLCYVMLLCTFNYSVVFATPSGATVVDGSLAVPVDYGTTTTVTVDTVKTILNWTSIDTDMDETLAFLKSGGGNFAVLNKVISGVPTNFSGTLSAPGGNIIIVNTSGLIFGGIANVRNLTLSGKNIANGDFLNGDLANPDNINYKFSGPGADVEVLSGAEIEAKLVALIGENVYNHGAITTDSGGYIVMGAGNTVQFGFVGSDIVVEVDGAGDSDVENDGELSSPDGTVWLAAGDVYSLAMSLEGTEAASINMDGENSVVLKDFGKKNELNLGVTSLDITTGRDGYVKFDKGSTVTSETGSISIIGGSGEDNGGVGIEIGNLIVGSETGKNPVAPQAGSIILGTVNGGDILAGYLNVFGGSSAQILVQAGGDLTLYGSSSNGAVMAKTNQVPTKDGGNAIVCLAAGGDLTVDYAIEAKAHGKKSAIADIHLHAGGTVDVDTHNGHIRAWAQTPADMPSAPSAAEATVRIHSGEGTTIASNGSNAPVRAYANAGNGDLVNISSSGESKEVTDGKAYAMIEIAENFVGECPGCLDLGDNDADADLDLDTDTDLDLDMDIDNDTDIDVDTDTDLDLDMDIDNDTDIDVDTDTDLDLDMDIDNDTDIDV